MKTAIVHILLPIVAAITINAIIYSNGWNDDNAKKNANQEMSKYLPPGYIIAVVWIFILGLLGYAHYRVYPSKESMIITLAIIYCLAYPFLTSGLQQSKAAIYNVLSFFIALIVLVSIYYKKRSAVIYTVPFLLWTLYVSSVTVLVNK